MTTIHPKLIEMMAGVILETCYESLDDRAIAVIEALHPLMERIAADGSRLEPTSLTVARHLAADQETKADARPSSWPLKPLPVEPPKPQSLREKWIQWIEEYWAYNDVARKKSYEMLDDLVPEGGPPSAWLQSACCWLLWQAEKPTTWECEACKRRIVGESFGRPECDLFRWPARKP